MNLVLELKLTPTPGADIAECCERAAIIAGVLGTAVEFEHNGVTVNVYHAQDSRAAHERWSRDMAKHGATSA